jgi:uncharacterized protein GlcG (DUF336 family)
MLAVRRLFSPKLLTSIFCVVLVSCGGGTDISSEEGSVDPVPPTSGSCIGQCANSATFLTANDVEIVLAQVVSEAQARNLKATIAVSDRVGNVLAVYRMVGAQPSITISSTVNTELAEINGGLEGISIIPDTMVAISKAITGAYISSEGNAFSTRTASQIVQENFNPGEDNTGSGPLFGVQFSQLACSDFSQRFSPLSLANAGPKRSPLGMSADTGGFPLYKQGTPVGSVGVISDGIYGLDKKISGFDLDNDELLALAGTVGFAAPLDRRGDVITIVGKTARYSDAFITDLISPTTLSFTDLTSTLGSLVAVTGYYDGGEPDLTASGDINRVALNGLAFGESGSGIVPADANIFKSDDGQSLDAYIFADNTNINRYPAINGSDMPAGDVTNRLTQIEVQELLNQALSIANKSRAQIRQPNGSQARVSISVVDTNGTILGMARTRDAPIFGSDVSLQKARTAVFFSKTGSLTNAPADLLRALPAPKYLDGGLATLMDLQPSFSDYVDALQLFLGVPNALESNGPLAAFSDRAGGNLSRPNFPDGPSDGVQGPLSKPAGEWSVFSVGLQSDLIYNGLINHVAFVAGILPTDVPQNCTGIAGLGEPNQFAQTSPINGLANGIQIFPGSVPIYRNDVLIGGIGVSGDGVDQDDMISFLAVHQAGIKLATNLQNAPKAIRADTIDIPNQDIRLRYVNCPQAPFLDSDITEVCNGL